MMETGSRTASA